MPNGDEVLEKIFTCKKEEYISKGIELAHELIEQGAKELLEKAEKVALNEVF